MLTTTVVTTQMRSGVVRFMTDTVNRLVLEVPRNVIRLALVQPPKQYDVRS